MTKNNKRKKIADKEKLRLFKRDNYTCQICGRNPSTSPGLMLEIDHIQPHSKGGTNDPSNLQVVCMNCNRGKGNDESLNKTIKNELEAIINEVNPEILEKLNNTDQLSVVANQEDYVKIIKMNSHGDFYKITPSTNTLFGTNAGKKLGIYTINDNCGSKVNFFIQKKDSECT